MKENLDPLFFKSILENLHGDVAIIDADFKYLFINPYAMKSAEMREWIIGKTDVDYCRFKGIDMSIGFNREAKLKEALELKKEVSWEEGMKDAQGNNRYFLRKVSPVFDGNSKKLIYFVGHGIEITDLQKIRHELEENKRIADAILSESPNSIFIKDAEGKFILVNSAVASLYETTPENLINKHNAEVHSNEEESKKYLDSDGEVIRTRKMKRGEETFTKRDGTVYWFDTVKVPIVETDGRVNVLGISTDITERKLNEILLRESERKLNEAQALSKSGSFEYNTETHEILWSQGMYLIYELDNSVQPSLDLFYTHLYPDDRSKIEELSRNLVVDSPPWSYTFRLISASGKLKHIEVFNKYSQSKETGATTIVGSYIDITERMEIEERLRLNDAQLNEVQEIAKLGTFELDIITNKVKYSKSAFHIYEWDENEPVPDGTAFINMVHPDDREYFNNLWTLLHSRKETFETNFRVILKSGVLKYIETINKLVRNSKNELVKIIGIISDVTERKLAADLIQKKEQKLIEAQRLSKTGSFELNWNTGELSWSLGMYAIWELDESVVPSIDLFYSTVHPEDREKLKLDEQAISEDSEPWSHEYRILTKNGNWKYISTFLKIVKLSSTEDMMIVGSCIDVSESKLAEEKLKLNEAKLLEAERLSNSGSWEVILFPEFYIEWSPGSFALWDMVIGKDVPTQENFYEHVHEEDHGKVRAAFKQMMENGDPVELNFRINTWANKEKVLYSKGAAIKDENGKVIKIYGTNTDVTKRQAEEERIKFSENSLLQAQRIAKLGSFYLDLRTNKFDWTEGVNYIWEMHTKVNELSFEEVLNTIHPEDRQKFIESINKAAQYGHKQMIEFRIIVGQNKVKNLEARLRVYDYDDGRAIKIFGTIIDITERKFVEQELVQAKKLAEESSKAKELFLANISHELRTPLNGILGMSRLLKKSSLSSVQRNYADVLHQTAENLLVIISEILDFTKIEEGKLTLEEVSFDPIRVADTAVNLQMFKAEEKDVLLRHKHIGGTPLPKVIGDPYRLSQILLNLLNNAIKFTNYGEVLLSHRIVAEDNDEVEIEFSVKDTGIGIPLGLQNKIFESFTQLDVDGKKNGGVGLGLTISKNLIEKQGGKIWVESKEDVGSTFYFSIKYKKSIGSQEKKGLTPIDLRDLGTMNILLAEDNKVNLFITESMLHDWGFNVDVAGDGEEVLRMMALKDYDMVLMDIQMPIMDGLEATKRIREMRDPQKSRVPVIALTANTGRQAHKQFMTLGMNDWVVKPFKEETLYRKLAMHLRGKDLLSESMRNRKFPTRKKPVAHPDDTLYDLSGLKNDQPSNRVFLIKMLSIFVDTIPASVENMFLHFENDELDQVSKIAHKIKPSIDGARIALLRDCIRNIEDYKEKKRNIVQMKSDLILLRKVITEVVVAFRMEIEKLKDDEN